VAPGTSGSTATIASSVQAARPTSAAPAASNRRAALGVGIGSRPRDTRRSAIGAVSAAILELEVCGKEILE
jgi:hypothetical protein